MSVSAEDKMSYFCRRRIKVDWEKVAKLLLLTLGLAYSYISTLSGVHTPPLHETTVEPAFTSIGQLEKATMQSISARNSI